MTHHMSAPSLHLPIQSRLITYKTQLEEVVTLNQFPCALNMPASCNTLWTSCKWSALGPLMSWLLSTPQIAAIDACYSPYSPTSWVFSTILPQEQIMKWALVTVCKLPSIFAQMTIWKDMVMATSVCESLKK
jgi:hypothetical protein